MPAASALAICSLFVQKGKEKTSPLNFHGAGTALMSSVDILMVAQENKR